MHTTRIISFKNCFVRAELNVGYTETVFADGSLVPAYPDGTPEQRLTSLRLGYGDDLARMCREHEVLHTWLCERFGLPYSPTLWAVAHGQQAGCAPRWAQEQEEALVLAFQACLNNASFDPGPLESIPTHGMNLHQLRREAEALLRAA